jgi:N utilization substance protein A
MTVRLSDEARRYIALYEEKTGVRIRDCLVDDDYDRLVMLVAAGEMADAIGPDGRHVRAVEDRVDRDVRLVEDATTAEAFVANALAPAAVYDVTIDGDDDLVARADVAEDDYGVAIGADGRNIDAARRLVKRHYDVDDIELA